MDPHLVEVPGLGTFTVRRLTGVDTERLSRKPNRTFDFDLLLLCPLDQLLADCTAMTERKWQGKFAQAYQTIDELMRRLGDVVNRVQDNETLYIL